MIKVFNEFINESLKDKLKGKSENEILNSVKNLSPIEKLEKGVNYGILSLVKQAIEEGIDPSSGDNYAIRFASKNGYIDIVKYLLKDKRVDPSDYSNNPIRFASLYGHLDVVKELLKDKRVDPSVQSNYAISFASRYGHLDVVKELLKDERVKNKLNKKYLERYKNQISSLNESLKDSLNNKLDYIKLLDKVENILETIKDKEYIEFDINKIYLYGGVLKKGFENTKDIDIFVEVSNYKSYSDKIDDNTSDFKEFLHEISENEYGHDFMMFNGKFLDINFTDYDFEFDFDEDEPRIELYDFYYNNKKNIFSKR